ncbi:MAG: hypothetical protein ACLGH1_11785 [Gammaproteobacteria bacterium]
MADAPGPGCELAARSVRISDAVQACEDGRFRVGACLDGKGSKLWFRSAARP